MFYNTGLAAWINQKMLKNCFLFAKIKLFSAFAPILRINIIFLVLAEFVKSNFLSQNFYSLIFEVTYTRAK